MHLAVRHNFPTLVQLLIDAGSDLDATDNVSGYRNLLVPTEPLTPSQAGWAQLQATRWPKAINGLIAGFVDSSGSIIFINHSPIVLNILVVFKFFPLYIYTHTHTLQLTPS